MVAFSGGPDSMALLHLLRDLAFDTDLRLEAAHFDHGIRSDSREESRRVVDMAAGLGIRCHVGGPPSRPGTTQASLRITRYRWLEEVRRDLSAARIAVGHHADDQAETVLFRLMRGTDVRGLAGIPIRRGPIVRPLLPLRSVRNRPLSEMRRSVLDLRPIEHGPAVDEGQDPCRHHAGTGAATARRSSTPRVTREGSGRNRQTLRPGRHGPPARCGAGVRLRRRGRASKGSSDPG